MSVSRVLSALTGCSLMLTQAGDRVSVRGVTTPPLTGVPGQPLQTFDMTKVGSDINKRTKDLLHLSRLRMRKGVRLFNQRSGEVDSSSGMLHQKTVEDVLAEADYEISPGLLQNFFRISSRFLRRIKEREQWIKSSLSNLRHSSLALDDLCCSSCVVVFALHVYATCILAAPYNDKRSEGRFSLLFGCFPPNSRHN